MPSTCMSLQIRTWRGQPCSSSELTPSMSGSIFCYPDQENYLKWDSVNQTLIEATQNGEIIMHKGNFDIIYGTSYGWQNCRPNMIIVLNLTTLSRGHESVNADLVTHTGLIYTMIPANCSQTTRQNCYTEVNKTIILDQTNDLQSC